MTFFCPEWKKDLQLKSKSLKKITESRINRLAGYRVLGIKRPYHKEPWIFQSVYKSTLTFCTSLFTTIIELAFVEHYRFLYKLFSSVFIFHMNVCSLSPVWAGEGSLEGSLQSYCNSVPQKDKKSLQWCSVSPLTSVLIVHEWNGFVCQCTLIWRNA